MLSDLHRKADQPAAQPVQFGVSEWLFSLLTSFLARQLIQADAKDVGQPDDCVEVILDGPLMPSSFSTLHKATVSCTTALARRPI